MALFKLLSLLKKVERTPLLFKCILVNVYPGPRAFIIVMLTEWLPQQQLVYNIFQTQEKKTTKDSAIN